jgi:hypothetical protein
MQPEGSGQACKGTALPFDICNFWRQLRVLTTCSSLAYEIGLERVSQTYVTFIS